MKQLFKALPAALLLLFSAACTPTTEPPTPSNNDPVVINEVNTDAKYIELYNPSTESVSLAGWTIRKNNEGPIDDQEGSGEFRIAEGITLPAGGYGVICCKGTTNSYDGVALGVSNSGVSGKKSLLLELLDEKGERVDYFVNTAKSAPKATDTWDDAVEHTFDVACRMPDGGSWWVVEAGSPGLTNNGAQSVAAFANTTVDFDSEKVPDDGSQDNPSPELTPLQQAVAYVWDEDTFPEVTLKVSEAEWNRMLKTYDQNSSTKQYFKGDVTFTNGTDTYEFEEAGWRLRGNTSRRRPEGNGGEMHNSKNPDWHHFHIQFNFRKYHKDAEHTIRGVRKIHMKWFKDDPMYVREVFCYDLFRRYGVWTAINDIYARLWIQVEGAKEPAYFGVYGMLETIDDEYLEVRSEKFGGHEGNLWKCGWGADLKNYRDDWKYGLDQDTDEEWVYELKTEHNSFSSAKEQLIDFMKKLNSQSGTQLHDWLGKVIDIPLFLKTYAVNVAVGMWDDYWNNSNNYYMYFNNGSLDNYKFYFIPYDYDNSLGTTHNCGVQNDAVTHNPLSWGNGNDNPLVAKILQFEDYRKLYIQYLNEIIDPSRGLMDYASSTARIRAWQSKIENYISNDTGEDMHIYDEPAGWGSHREYRLLEDNNNYFKTKAKYIPKN